jgi:chromosome segregation ATPase
LAQAFERFQRVPTKGNLQLRRHTNKSFEGGAALRSLSGDKSSPHSSGSLGSSGKLGYGDGENSTSIKQLVSENSELKKQLEIMQAEHALLQTKCSGFETQYVINGGGSGGGSRRSFTSNTAIDPDDLADEQELEQLRGRVSQLQSENSTLRSASSDATQISELVRRVHELEGQNTLLKTQLDTATKSVETEKANSSLLQQQIEAQDKELEEMVVMCESAQNEVATERARSELAQQALVSSSVAEITIDSINISSQATELSRLRVQLETLLELDEALQQDIEHERAAHAATQEIVQKFKQVAEQQKRMIGELQSSVTQLQKYRKKYKRIERKKSKGVRREKSISSLGTLDEGL